MFAIPKLNPNHNPNPRDRRAFEGTYICPLYRAPDGCTFRHVNEDVYAYKDCDAYQTTWRGTEVIYACRDLVEVMS